MMTQTVQKGSEEERRKWKKWTFDNGFTDADGRFIFTAITSRRSRFRNGHNARDVRLLRLVEHNIIELVHLRNSVIERWPETIRTMLNRTQADQDSGAFVCWTGPPGLEKRIQATRVWTDLVQFFMLEYHINKISWSGDSTSQTGHSFDLTDMGFTVSEDMGDDILDIVKAEIYGMDHIKDAVHEFCLKIIMQENPTPHNNPLLFWVALCLQTEEFGNQQRLEFDGVKDELTMREKLEALVYYARVFIMDLAFQRFDSVSKEGQTTITNTLNSKVKDYSWIDSGLLRPVDQQGDPPEFAQKHWQAFKVHFEAFHTRWLVKGSNSPIGMILGLL